MKKILITIFTLLLIITNKTYSQEDINYKENNFNNLLFYYWYPTHIAEWWKYYNDDRNIQDQKRIELVSPFFSQFKKIVWAWDLAFETHEEYQNTIKIINNIKKTTESYWYVPMYWDGNDSNSDKICSNVEKWIKMWVDWIFYDEAWFDYFEQKNQNYNDYIKLLNDIYKCSKDKWLKIIFNSWSASDIINNVKLDSNDWVLIESFYYWNGINKQSYIDNVEKYKKLKNNTEADFYCVATSKKWESQNNLNEIWIKIKDEMMNVCEYRSIQDHYWSSSNVIYVTDDIFNIKKENKVEINNNIENSNNKDEKLNNELDELINNFFLKIKSKSSIKSYNKKLIIIIWRVKILKLSNKYSNNEKILSLLKKIEEKARSEYKINK
jgi:hypothetical protein